VRAASCQKARSAGLYAAISLPDASRWLSLAGLLIAASAQAIQVCELDGRPVNPNNGAETANKTGLLRCRDGENGPVVREQELKAGVYVGIVRYYNPKTGAVLKEYSVNERGNRDGRSREWGGGAPENPLLVDETLRNSTPVGLSRRWHPNGALRRATWYGDDGREQALAEFTESGKLAELRCGPAPQLAPAADDAAWCGFRAAAPVTTELYAHKGWVNGRVTYQRGELRKRESVGEDGKPQRQVESDADGGVERDFGAGGALRREKRWLVKTGQGERSQRIVVLEREYHESGTLVRERRWTPADSGATLALEQQWYLNGQPRDKQEYATQDGQPLRRETRYHDNGRVAFEASWLLKGRYDTQAVGTQKSYDEQGRLRGERMFDARGRLARERELDEAGRVQRDDEVFEDGSRKAYAR